MPEATRTGSTCGCLLQLFWTLVGPGLLLATGAMLIVQQPPLGAWPDFAFLGLASAVALARLLDTRPTEPEAETGAIPAASGRFRYVALLAGVVLLILAVAHLLAPRIP